MRHPPVLPLSLLNLLLLCLGSSTSQGHSAPGEPQQTGVSLHHPSWSLGLRLYQALRRQGPQTNTLLSPVLLANSLAALSCAAKGSTAEQLRHLLKTTGEEREAEEAIYSALKSVHKGNGTSYRLHSSSALFSKQVLTLEEGFLQDLRAQLGLRHVALGAGGREADVEELCSWAKGGMGGLEGEPLTLGSDAQEGALILASALRFKSETDGWFYRSSWWCWVWRMLGTRSWPISLLCLDRGRGSFTWGEFFTGLPWNWRWSRAVRMA